MSANTVEQVVSKMKQAGEFALQLDEMTDVSGEAFVHYEDVSEAGGLLFIFIYYLF